jgi:DNA topoisomerase III
MKWNSGFISYPRTETDKFPSTMNLQDLVNRQSDNAVWGNYAQNLL